MSALVAAMLVGLLAVVAFVWPGPGRPPRIVEIAGFFVGTAVAALIAWRRALGGDRNPIWEPTR